MHLATLINRIAWSTPARRLGARRALVLALCLIVGVLSGLAAVYMHNLAGFVHSCFRTLLANSPYPELLAPALPSIGIFFCIIVSELFFHHASYGCSLWPAILEARHPGRGLPPYHTFSHIITAGVSVGSGISAGMEAPSALTGAAIGVNLGRWFGVSRETISLLLAAGGAAGIAAVFDAPLGGTLFACEVLLPRVSSVLFIPLLLSAASGAIISQVLRANNDFLSGTYAWELGNIWLYILVGIICGVFSWGIIRTNCILTRLTARFKNRWLCGLIGCILLYAFFFALPVLGGQGYNFVTDFLCGRADRIPTGLLPRNECAVIMPIFAALLAALLKPLVSMLSLRAGGDGGLFGPSLVTGGFLGYALHLIIAQSGIGGFPLVNCITAGMAGVLAGVMHAPLTGLFLIAELLGGYQLFVPLMIVVAISTFVSKGLTRNNIYFAAAAESNATAAAQIYGDDAIGELDSTPVGELADHNYYALSAKDKFRSLLEMLMRSPQQVFPVLDDKGTLIGMVSEKNIRPYILNSSLYDVLIVDDFMAPPPRALDANDTVGEATAEFDRTHTEFLPVLNNGRFVGMLSKASLLENYRWHLDNIDLF